MNSKRIATIVMLIIGIGLFIGLLYYVGPENIVLHLKSFKLADFLIFMFFALLLRVVITYRWKIILDAMGHRIGFWTLFGYSTAGFAISYLTPTSLSGSHPLKAIFLKRDNLRVAKAFSSLFIDAVSNLPVTILFGTFAILVLLTHYTLSRNEEALILVIMLILFAVISWFYYRFFAGKGVMKPAIKILSLKRIHPLRFFIQKIEEMEDHIIEFLKERKSTFLRALLISTLGWFLLFCEFYFGMRAIGHNGNIIEMFFITSIISLTNLAPIPASMGIQEFGQVALAPFLSIATSLGLTFSLVLRIRDIILVLFGVICLVYYGPDVIHAVMRDLSKKEDAGAEIGV